MTSPRAEDNASPPAACIGRRMLALFYDLWPVLALWFLVAVPFVLVDVLISGDVRHNIGPFSAMQWLLWIACWLVTGGYATASWKRGGQTLGARPWRIRVVVTGDAEPDTRRWWLRYAVGTVSLLLAGAGFWWAWLDRDRLTWHDRAAGTRVVRVPKPL